MMSGLVLIYIKAYNFHRRSTELSQKKGQTAFFSKYSDSALKNSSERILFSI